MFSLQELEHCVLRGRLPRPNLKDLPKRFAPLPPENDEHYFYSLTKASSRSRIYFFYRPVNTRPPFLTHSQTYDTKRYKTPKLLLVYEVYI